MRELTNDDLDDIRDILNGWRAGDDFAETVVALSEVFNPPKMVLYRMELDTLELHRIDEVSPTDPPAP
jgi:hypothetical protein